MFEKKIQTVSLKATSILIYLYRSEVKMLSERTGKASFWLD